MTVIDLRALLFSVNCYVAAVLALGIAFLFNMPNPWWAALTVYLTSQPQNAAIGAVWGRALHRLVGTAVGMLVSLALVPPLSDTPRLLLVLISAWIAACVYFGLLDRTPRAYAFLLAGFSVAFVGLPAVNDPLSLWDSAVLRTEQIGIGVLCAAVVHSVMIPRTVRQMVGGKLTTLVAEARQWLRGALDPVGAPEQERTARRKMAVDLTDLNLLSRSLAFESSDDKVSRQSLRALEAELVCLLPLMISAEDRIHALREVGALPEPVRRSLSRVSQCIASDGALDAKAHAELIAECEALAGPLDAYSGWPALLLGSLAARLVELSDSWRRVMQLAKVFDGARDAHVESLNPLLDLSVVRDLHRDRGLAAFSALAVALAAIAMGSFAIAADWAQGAAAVGITAAGSSVFAFADDPSPMLLRFLKYTFVAVPVAALYVFAILPLVDGYVMLAAALSPVLVASGYFLAIPAYSLQALAFGLVFNTLLGLQPSAQPDFFVFANVSIATVMAVIVSLLVTRLIRVIRADVSVGRILRAGWRELVELSIGSAGIGRSDWLSRMLDRQALLSPRLAGLTSPDDFRNADALNDVLIGMNVIVLRSTKGLAPAPSRCVESVMSGLGRHFLAAAKDGRAVPPDALLRGLDEMLLALLSDIDGLARREAVAAGIGLRRSMFPLATAFRSLGQAG